MRIEIRNGRLVDPANGVDGSDGSRRSLWIEDGRIIGPPPRPQDWRADRLIDAQGRWVLPGGIDIHCHIAGAAINRARRLLVREKAGDALAPRGALRPGTGGLVPSTAITGYRYAAMGYTTAVEAAVPPAGARQCHLELADTPCIDKALLLIASEHPLVLEAIQEGEPRRVTDLLRELLAEAGAFGLKAVNPGGAAHWQRSRGLVERLETGVGGSDLTPRRIILALAQAAAALGLPHPLHLHCNQLGIAGNVETTLATIAALEGQRAHLAHLQFHAYGRSPRRGGLALASAAPRLAEALAAHPKLSADVGQVWFGEALTLSADRPLEHRLWGLTGKRWVNVDAELESGCGMVPIEYQPRSRVHALQWAVGLELLLLSPDPWRLVLSTDHPNGASFLAYPRLLAALMDRGYRDEILKTLDPQALAGTALQAGIRREYTLAEVATITRAAPARLLGLAHQGHLGPGADADLVVYDEDRDRARMFAAPRWVLKAGEVVVEDGELRAPVAGRTLRAALERDAPTGRSLAAWRAQHSTVQPHQHGLGSGELAALAAVPLARCSG